MQFYTRQHRHYCGVDLHARTMYVCVLDQAGNVLVSKDIASAPEPFLELIAPYREDLAVAAECMFTWQPLRIDWTRLPVPNRSSISPTLFACLPPTRARH